MNTVGLGVAITLADMFTPKLNKAGKGVMSFNAKLAALSTASAGIGKRLAAGLGQHYEAFSDVAQKQGDLMSLDVDTKGMEAITKKGLAFSNTWSGVITKDFVGAAYDIKSGISSLTDDGVGEMTRYALLTGKATKSNSETMSKSFALGYGIFRSEFKDDFDFGQKFSASLAATVQLFRTDGEDLARGISNLGATAQKFGVSLAEELAVLGMSKSAFDSAAEGATSYKAFLMAATKAQKGLGLSFVDPKGKLLPMVKILEKIKKKYGDIDAKEIGELKKEFGSDEAVKIIMALIDKTDELRESQKKLNDAQRKGLDYTKEMAKAREFGQEAKLLGDQINSLSITFGKALAPSMGWVTKEFGSLVTKITVFVTEHEEMASVVATGLVALAGTATVLGTLGIAIAGTTLGLEKLGLKAVVASTGISTTTASVGGLKASLLGLGAVALITIKLFGLLGEASKRSIDSKRFVGKSRQEMLEKQKYLKDRLHAMKSGGMTLDGVGERLLHGSVTQTKIVQYEKLLAKTNKYVDATAPIPKTKIPTEPAVTQNTTQNQTINEGDVIVNITANGFMGSPKEYAAEMARRIRVEMQDKKDRSVY